MDAYGSNDAPVPASTLGIIYTRYVQVRNLSTTLRVYLVQTLQYIPVVYLVPGIKKIKIKTEALRSKKHSKLYK